MADSVHVHVPYPHLEEAFPFLIERRLNVELFFSADTLDQLVPEQLAAAAARLAGEGLNSSIHAPFMDLNPGSFEPLLRDATRRRFHQVMDAAALLNPRVVVFHPGFDKWRYGDARERWMAQSIPLWEEMVVRSAETGCIVAVDNIFEEEPSTLKDLIEAVDSPRFRHCFDAGHWNLFATVGLEEWFAALGPYLAETHIHDNRGVWDEHAPIGEGNIDVDLYFSLLDRFAPDAVRTIEAHSREKLERALKNLAAITR
jgi:sugar phosphate isomerase/epimerase